MNAHVCDPDSDPAPTPDLDRSPESDRHGTSTRCDRGQATSEYALVMLAAALIALLAVGWASGGGGAGKIGQMFDRVVDNVTTRLP